MFVQEKIWKPSRWNRWRVKLLPNEKLVAPKAIIKDLRNVRLTDSQAVFVRC